MRNDIRLRCHLVPRKSKAHGSTGSSLERSMHGARVAHEVGASPWIAREELEWEAIALETVAGATRHNEVARFVRAASCERHDVVECRGVLVEARRAVHTALSAVA